MHINLDDERDEINQPYLPFGALIINIIFCVIFMAAVAFATIYIFIGDHK